MYGLKSEFDPEKVPAVYLRKEIKYIVPETVRTGPYNETFYSGILKDLVILFSQLINRSIRVRMILKICEISGIRLTASPKGIFTELLFYFDSFCNT